MELLMRPIAGAVIAALPAGGTRVGWRASRRWMQPA